MLGRKTGAGFYKYEGKSQTPNEALAQWRRGVVAGGADPGRGEGQHDQPAGVIAAGYS